MLCWHQGGTHDIRNLILDRNFDKNQNSGKMVEDLLSLLAGSTDVTRRAPSVTSGLRKSIQPTALIGHLCEQQRNVNAFSTRKISTTSCTFFPYKISHFMVLAMFSS